jgi:methyl-accepting chemotaxis protein
MTEQQRMPPEPNSFGVQLGELRGIVTGLRETQAATATEMERMREARHEMSATLGELAIRFERLSTAVEGLTKQLTTMQTSVTPLIDLKRNAVALIAVFGFIFSLLSYIFAPEVRAAAMQYFHLS